MANTSKSKKKVKALESMEPEAVQASDDRPEDPLFVPRIDFEAVTAESLTEDRDEYEMIFETICGATDDSQPVEQYDGSLGVTAALVAQHETPVCQVQWNDNLASIYSNPGNVSGVRWGTGTMISDDVMITCGHLFDQTGGGWQRPRVNGSSNIISPEEIAQNMKVNFNFQVDSNGNQRPEQSFAVAELLEYRLGAVDMAICRIDGNPGASFGRALVSTTDAAPPEMIFIIGHPAGRPKRIEAGPTTSIQGDRIRYNDIDTLGGNSGSGILRANDGRIVGVHTNGGCGPQSPGPGGGSNFGLRIEKFIDVSPTLQSLISPKLKVADDVATLKFSDDGGKSKFSDDVATFKFSDDGGKFKFRDDVATLKFSDDNSTLKFRDDKRKSFDDVKSPFRDKGFDGPGSGRFGARQSAEQPGGAGSRQRPFVLSTPHHADPYQGTGYRSRGTELQEWEAYLSELAAAIESGAESMAQMEQEYRTLLAEYNAATGQGFGW